VIDSLFQIQILTGLKPGMKTEGLETVTCNENNEESHVRINGGALRYSEDYPFCGRVKYHYPNRTPISFSRNCFSGVTDIVKSHEYMGSGGEAHRLVIVSQKIYQLSILNSWRGIYFEPVFII
jgi:hypothetical protein